MFAGFKLFSRGASLSVAICLYGCAIQRSTGPEKIPLKSATIRDDLDADSLRTAIHQSLAYLKKLPPDRIVGEQPRHFTAQEIADSLSAFEAVLKDWQCPDRFAQEVAARFDFVPSSADAELAQILFTGYYQPVLNGSLTRTERFRYPLYGMPADLISAEQVTLGPKPYVEKILGRAEGEQFVPYYSRREIDEAGSLRGRGLEIAWVDDPVELFFLHIQGSGLIRLPDGETLSVGYAGQNGRPYRSIGRLLIDDGAVPREEMSMQRLRRYLDDHPQRRAEVFNYNESYVFFRVLQNGPLGSLEVPVTAGRSIATDAHLFPKGALVLIQTEIPRIDNAGQLAGWRPITRFALNQDTGGAIRGLRRADIYFGSGDEAAGLAGYMNRPGKMFFLMPKPDLPPANAGSTESCAERVSKSSKRSLQP